MRRTRRSTLAWIAICALAGAAVVLLPRPWTAGAPSASTRLLAPLAGVLANLQWVRVERAMHAGRPELVLARSQRLLELDARSGDAHVFVSMYFAFSVASPERELDPERRARWLRIALELVRSGEESAGAPAELALWQGELLARAAQIDPHIAWPGGLPALWGAAAEHFERAQTLGSSLAPERAAAAREAQRQSL